MLSLHSLRMQALVARALASCASASPTPGHAKSTSYEDLVALFADWRAFQRPPLVDGVPDYSRGAMGTQRSALTGYRQRLEAIDPAG